MNRYQIALADLKGQFEHVFKSGSASKLNVLLLQSQGITPAEAIGGIPERFQRPEDTPYFGTVYGKMEDRVTRTCWFLDPGLREATGLFWDLCGHAGTCLADWAVDYEIDERTLNTKCPKTHWMFTLFELAWTQTPLYPTRAERVTLAPIAMQQLRIAWLNDHIKNTEEAHSQSAAIDPPAGENAEDTRAIVDKANAEIQEKQNEIKEIVELGFYAVMRDPLLASMQAINTLTAERISRNSQPPHTRRNGFDQYRPVTHPRS